MLKKILLPFIILFFYAGMYGQENAYLKKIDSLKLAFNKTTVDTIKATQLIYISRFYAGLGDSKNGREYATKALQISNKAQWSPGKAEAYVCMAIQPGADAATIYKKALTESLKTTDKRLTASLYNMLGQTATDYNQKIDYFKKALPLFREINDNKNYRKVLFNIAYAYELKGMYFDAVDYRMQNLKFSEQLKDTIGIVNANRHLALTYSAKGDTNKALLYYLAATTLMKQHSKKANALFISDIYNETGKIYLIQKKYDKALAHFKEALTYAKSGRYNLAQIDILQYISKVYLKLNNKPEASAYLNKAKQLTNLVLLPQDKLMACNSVASAAYESADYPEAIKYYRIMLDIVYEFENNGEDMLLAKQIAISGLGASYLALAKQQGNNKDLLFKSINNLETVLPLYKQANSFKELQVCSQQLAEAYELTGQYSKSVTAYKDYITYKDSISSIDRENAFTKKEAEFEYTQKETLLKADQKIAIEKEQNRRNYALAGIGVLLLIAGGSGVAYSRKKKDNRLIAAEKKRSDDLLLNILPAEVAEELKSKGEASAQYHDKVSIIFTDFVGFTKLSEKFSPQELIAELNHCFKAFDNIITKYNIEKIKTIGDSYMAVCGLAGKNPDHAKNAVAAAIEMRNFIDAYKTERLAQGKVYFEMRIGINSGNVVAGIVGIKKFAYDVWGDAVNIASRMESHGQAGKVNISESTYNLVKDDYTTQYRGEIDAKGKGLINMYFVEPKQVPMDIKGVKDFILDKQQKELPEHLSYHNIHHILDVYDAVKRHIEFDGITGEDAVLLQTAALFHDSGFIVQAQGHEEISCGFAHQYLPQYGYNSKQINVICGIIMATKIPQSPKTPLEEILADSDLDYLGRDDFFAISDRLFDELKYSGVVANYDDWNKMQVGFFNNHRYFTASAKAWREAKKAEHLKSIKAKLIL